MPENALHCGKGVDSFNTQAIGNLLWSYAKQAQLADETITRVDGVESSSNGRQFVMSTMSLDVGETLIKRLFNACAETLLTKFGMVFVI